MFIDCLNDKVLTYKLENTIQAREIQHHLQINNITNDYKNNEANIWIKEYAKDFRNYIDTMKNFIFHFRDQIGDYDNFCIIVDIYNEKNNDK